MARMSGYVYRCSGLEPLPDGYEVVRVSLMKWDVYCNGEKVGEASQRVYAHNVALRHSRQQEVNDA